MIQNHKLAQALSDVSIGTFNQFLEYKAKWYGVNLLRCGRFEPSSKTCNSCGQIKTDLKLSDRVWVCSGCDSSHDRDVNAAKNIRDFCFTIRQGLPKFTPVESRTTHSLKQEVAMQQTALYNKHGQSKEPIA